MTDGLSDGRVEFEVDGATLTVRDAIEGEELRLRTDVDPDLSPALPELFPSPIDRAVSFEAESLEIPEYASIVVRDADGDHVARLNEPMDLPRGSYCIEVNGATKALIRVTDAEICASGADGPEPVTLSFGRPQTVSVGGRSLHTRPEATITVPDDPAALTEAVSVLGSSIKEFTPERSWPTLRGYPPRIERGDSLDIPGPLTVPDTGVEVVVRPTYADVYRLSTLSYYLGARMTTGDAPAIRLDTGYEERLPTEGRALEERVTELFETWFFLDTLVRTEGYVPSDRYDYEEVGPSLPFYPPNLADRTMSERLMEYLEVDHETVAAYLPTWPTEAVLRAVPAAVELLPHLAHVLAPIRVRGSSFPSAPHERLALATAVPPHGQPSAAHHDGDNVPDVTADPIPSWSSAISSVAYDNDLPKIPPDHGNLNVVFLIGSADRAQGVRNALTSPSVPDGIGLFSVLESPDGETVRDIWSEPSADLVYSDLPIEDDQLVAADGPVTFPSISRLSERNGPTVSIFEGSRDVDIGLDTLTCGGVAAAFLNSPLAFDQIRATISLLASVGTPLNTTLSVVSGGDTPSVRFAGNASASVVPPTAPVIEMIFVESQSVSSHELTFGTPIAPASWIGGEYNLSPEFLDKRARLIGYGMSEKHEVPSEGVVSVAEEPETVLFLNGELVPPGRGLTVEDVEVSARSAASNIESSHSTRCE